MWSKRRVVAAGSKMGRAQIGPPSCMRGGEIRLTPHNQKQQVDDLSIPCIASYTRRTWDPPAVHAQAGNASSRPPPPRVRRAVGGTCGSRHTGRPVRALTACASPRRQRCTRAQRGERKSQSKETRAGQCDACGDWRRSQ